MGGKNGAVEQVPMRYQLLEKGTRHLFFLTLNTRGIVPSYTGVDANFVITGLWTGNFGIDNNVVRTTAGHPDIFKQYDKRDAGVFMNEVASLVLQDR